MSRLFLRYLSLNSRLRFFSISPEFRQIDRRNKFTHIGITHTASFFSEASDNELEEVQDDAKATEKETALRLAIAELANDFGNESMLSMKRFFGSRRASVISTGSMKLDQALGIGGLPKGRIVEIYGQEASGKTTLALHVIKEAQKLGGYCAFIDAENAMDPSLATSIGVKTEKLLISRPDSAENLLSVVDTLTRSGSVDVIVVDSGSFRRVSALARFAFAAFAFGKTVAALAPQSELEVPIGDSHGDIQSKLMNKALRKIHSSLCNSQTLIIFLNQTRSNVKSSSGFGFAEEVTCGGNALGFHAAVRLKMIRSKLLRNEDKIIGLVVSIQVMKNKLSPGTRKADVAIRFGRGFHVEREVLELACEHGVVIREGNSFFIEGEVISSEDAAEKYLAENEEVLGSVISILRKRLFVN